MIVGTAGHVNHGKSTLVKALTGVDPDRLEEEKRRGMTITLGYAQWKIPGGPELSVIDVPGHRQLVRTMIAGAGGFDLVLLAVAADEGVMPQTREHLSVCSLLGITKGVVALTRIDRAEDVEVAKEIVELDLEGTALEGAPVIPVNALTGDGLDVLAQAMTEAAGTVKKPADDGPLHMVVDRAFSLKGHGTVLTGSLLQGTIKEGETVLLLPRGDELRVRSIQVHGSSVKRARPGRRVALNLPDVHPDDVHHGSFITRPGEVVMSDVLDVKLRLLPHMEKPRRRFTDILFLHGTSRSKARVQMDEKIKGDQGTTARIRLSEKTPLMGQGRFVLRGPGHPQFGAVVGGGVILDPDPPKKRRAPERLGLEGKDLRSFFLEEAGRQGVGAHALAARLGLRPGGEDKRVFSDSAIADAKAEMVAAVKKWHLEKSGDPGMPLASLDLGPITEVALEAALKERLLKKDGPMVHTPDHQARFSTDDAQLSERLLRLVGKNGLAAPRQKELESEGEENAAAIRRVLALLEREERIVRSDGFCFPGREARALRATVAKRILEGTPMRVADLKEMAGVSRKQGMPLLAWLDRCGVTKRQGDARVAGPKAGDFVAP
jgi:selenocysteine-specific elongation factor